MEFVIAIIFLITSYLFGYLLTVRFFPAFKSLLRIATAYTIGTLISVWLVFLLSLILYPFTQEAMTVGFTLATVFLVAITIHQRALFKVALSLRPSHVIFFIIAFLYSWILFSSTLDYDIQLNEIRIARFIWSDYGFHIPIIRSFSFGNNLSLENPIYAYESLRYHFLFDFMAGVLEKMDVPLDYAINLPSALFFTSLLVLIFHLGKTLFYDSRFVGFVSVALFLFNSSLSFVEFIKKHSVGSFSSLINNWWNLREYVAFGPWDGNIIGAFWNWNIYINQRQLILGCALVVIVLNHFIYQYFSREKKFEVTYGQNAFIGLISGLLVLWHSQVFLCLFGLLCLFFLLFPDRKKNLLAIVIALLVAIPQILWIRKYSPDVESHFSLYIGYFVGNHLIPIDFTPYEFLNRAMSYELSFIRYWFFNIGLSLFTVTVSFFLVDSVRKKLFLMFLSLFILGNLFRFSPEIGANHKFFNLWLLLSNMYTAYLLYRLIQFGWSGTVLSVILIFFLTLSGIVDIPPIKNDYKIIFPDIERNPLTKWVMDNTDESDVFLTTYRIYNPVSFAGRKTMLGWPYFSWSAGFDTVKREQLAKQIYEASSKEELCKLLKENKVVYILTEKQFDENSPFKINHGFFNSNFDPVFFNKNSDFKERVFATRDICDI